MSEVEIIRPLELEDASAGVHLSEPAQPAPVEKQLSRDEFAKGFAWTSVFSMIAKVIFPLGGIYINRRLGPTIIGIGATLQMTVQLSEVFREAGLTQTFVNELDISEEILGSYTALKLLSSLFPALVVLGLTPFFVSFFGQSEFSWSIPWISLCLLLNGLGAVPTAQLIRRGEFKKQGLIGISAAATGLGATLVLVALGAGFASIVAQLVVTCVANLFFTLRAQPLCRPIFNWEIIRSRARKSRALLGANVLNNLFLLSDIFVITKLVGVRNSGLYNISQNVAYKPLDLFLFPLNKTLMVAFGQTKDRDRMANIYWRAISAIILLLVPMYSFLACNATGIIQLMYGSEFMGGVPVLVVLSLYLACRSLGSVSGNALVPIGRHVWTFYPWILALLVTVGGLFLIHPHPSLMGVVWCFTWGAITVYMTTFLLAANWLRPTPEALSGLGKSSLVLAGSALCMLGLQLWSISPIARLLLGAPIVLFLHLVIAGLVIEKSISAFLSPGGAKRLYRAL